MLFKTVSDNFSGLLFTKQNLQNNIDFHKKLNHEQANQTAHCSCSYVIIFLL